MRYFVLTLVALCFGLSSKAQKIQKSHVPPAVAEVFQQDFPKAADIDWKKRDSLYEVEFELGAPKKDHTIIYNATGKLVYHEEDITIDQLPPAVLKQVRAQFPGFRVEEIERTENRGLITYHMEVESSSEEWKLAIDAEGKVLNKSLD